MSVIVVTQSLSYEKSKQGVEIKYFEEIFSTLLPRFMNNSSPAISENGKAPEFSSIFRNDTSFFDINSYDASLTSPLLRLENNLEIIGQNTIEFVPNHVADRRDYGTPSLFDHSLPFHDYRNSDIISYLTMQGDTTHDYVDFDLNYPYILDLQNPIDPHSYDGIIEPFTLRSWDTLQNEDKPISSRKVKGTICNYKEDQFGFCVPIEQKIYMNDWVFDTRPYLEYGDMVDRYIEVKTGYFSDEPEEFMPYNEIDPAIELSKTVDEEISRLLSTQFLVENVTGKKYISSATGYTFIDRQNGTDSIAFLDQRGY